MSREVVACNQCGAQIEIAASTNFVSCARCGVALVVRRTESSTFTERVVETEITTPELAGRLEPRTQPASDALAELQRLSELNRLENELTRLDLDWQHQREQYKIWVQFGQKQIPTRTMSALSGALAAAFVGVWICVIFHVFSDPMAPDLEGTLKLWPLLLVFVFIGYSVGYSIYAFNKALAYEEAERSHRSRRTDLLKQIIDLRQPRRGNDTRGDR